MGQAGGRERRDFDAQALRHLGERLGGGIDHTLVLDRTRDAKVGVAGTIERREVAAHILRREPRDVGTRSDDSLAQRVVTEHQAAGDVVRVDLDAVLGVVLVDLLEDQGPLELDVGEPRAPDQLPEEADRRRDMLGLEGELEQGVVAAGLGVQGRAELLDGRVEGERGQVLLGPPEQHVLDEVGQAVVHGGLEPRPDLDEQRHHGGVEVGQGDRGHVQAVVEPGGLDLRVQAAGGSRGPSFH